MKKLLILALASLLLSACQWSVTLFGNLDNPNDLALSNLVGGRHYSLLVKAGIGSTPGQFPDEGQSGVGGAQIGSLGQIASDAAGNVFFTDTENNRVMKLDTAGLLHTIAGTGVAGFSGDGGQATSAQLSLPCGIALDSSGNIYIGDSGNEKVRKIDTSGTISTLLSVKGFLNGSSGTASHLGTIRSFNWDTVPQIECDSSSNVYVLIHRNMLIKLAAGMSTYTIVAGKNTPSGNDGTSVTPSSGIDATTISYVDTFAVSPTGTVYLTGTSGQIYRIDGQILTPLGTALPTSPYGLGYSVASSSVLALLSGSVVTQPASGAASSTQVVTNAPDTGNVAVNSLYGTIFTIADGIGTLSGKVVSFRTPGSSEPANTILLPSSSFIAANGTVYFTEPLLSDIRALSGGTITVVAGIPGTSGATSDGPATSTSMMTPKWIGGDAAGNLYVHDSGQIKLFKISGGAISTLSADSSVLGGASGFAASPVGDIYVSQPSDNTVWKLANGSSSWVRYAGVPYSVVSGNGWVHDGNEGSALLAHIAQPGALAFANDVTKYGAGTLFITETATPGTSSTGYHVRAVDGSGVIHNAIGNGSSPATSSWLNQVMLMSSDNIGRLIAVGYAFNGDFGFGADPFWQPLYTDPTHSGLGITGAFSADSSGSLWAPSGQTHIVKFTP